MSNSKKQRFRLWDGVNENFKVWLYDDELDRYKKIWFRYPHDPNVRMLDCTATREISIECLDAHLTQYFMLMQQTVVSRVRAVIYGRSSVPRSEVKEMVVKFCKDYAKSHNYAYLGILSTKRVEGVVHQLCDKWLTDKTNVKVTND